MPNDVPDLMGRRGLDGSPAGGRDRGRLARSFVLPPFTVLNAREGWWQDRKKAWTGLGIQSEIGRGGNLLELSGECEDYRRREGNYAGDPDQVRDGSRASPGGFPRPPIDYSEGESTVAGRLKRKEAGEAGHASSVRGKGSQVYGMTRSPYGNDGRHEATMGQPKKRRRPDRDPSTGFGVHDDRGPELVSGTEADCGTSIFDPVLCELAYRWFCPAGGRVLDPFAGGSVRGIVAGYMGYRYWGCDLRAEQIAANRAQGDAILGQNAGLVTWTAGDSLTAFDAAPAGDMLFTCPPYADLERYSDDPRDISNMEYPRFLKVYGKIILEAADRLRADRFAAVVVGDLRGPGGVYRNFVSHTIRTFQRAGLDLYNEAILITPVGSLSVRTPRQFAMSRKLGKTHQNILVFVKGDPVRATDAVTGLTADERRAALKVAAEQDPDAWGAK